MTVANAMIQVDQTSVPLALPSIDKQIGLVTSGPMGARARLRLFSDFWAGVIDSATGSTRVARFFTRSAL